MRAFMVNAAEAGARPPAMPAAGGGRPWLVAQASAASRMSRQRGGRPALLDGRSTVSSSERSERSERVRTK